MKGTAFVLLLGGWAIALAGVLMSDATADRATGKLGGTAVAPARSVVRHELRDHAEAAQHWALLGPAAPQLQLQVGDSVEGERVRLAAPRRRCPATAIMAALSVQ